MDTLETEVGKLNWIGIAGGKAPIFKPRDHSFVLDRWPIRYYRVPTYLRGDAALADTVIEPPELRIEEQGFERDPGVSRHYYRLSLPTVDFWTGNASSSRDTPNIEVFEACDGGIGA